MAMQHQWTELAIASIGETSFDINDVKLEVFTHVTFPILGQLSLASLRGGLIEYQLRLG